MKKTELILKKAALFEKLALYGSRQDFLQALAIMPDEWNERFQQLLKDMKRAIVQIPADKRDSDDGKMAIVLVQNALDISHVEQAIPYLKKVVPWMRDPNNSIEQAYHYLKSSWQLPDAKPETMQVGLSTGPLSSSSTPAATSKPSQSIDDLFNFYYAKLLEVQKSGNKQSAESFLPKMEKLVTQLDNMSAKVVVNNPKESTRLSALADKGRYLAHAIRMQLNMTTPMAWSPEEPMRRPEY